MKSWPKVKLGSHYVPQYTISDLAWFIYIFQYLALFTYIYTHLA